MSDKRNGTDAEVIDSVWAGQYYQASLHLSRNRPESIELALASIWSNSGPLDDDTLNFRLVDGSSAVDTTSASERRVHGITRIAGVGDVPCMTRARSEIAQLFDVALPLSALRQAFAIDYAEQGWRDSALGPIDDWLIRVARLVHASARLNFGFIGEEVFVEGLTGRRDGTTLFDIDSYRRARLLIFRTPKGQLVVSRGDVPSDALSLIRNELSV